MNNEHVSTKRPAKARRVVAADRAVRRQDEHEVPERQCDGPAHHQQVRGELDAAVRRVGLRVAADRQLGHEVRLGRARSVVDNEDLRCDKRRQDGRL